VQKIFIGRDGIRAGWRIALFLVLVAAEGVMLISILAIAAHVFPALRGPLRGAAHRGLPFTPLAILFGEGFIIVLLLIAARVMSLIEQRPMDDYGLPARDAFRGRFWEGAVWGFVAIAAVMGAIAASGDLQIGIASTGAAAAGGLLLWAVAFMGVGLSEEFLFRGYVLFTLARGIRFTPAAIVLGVLFALAHSFNPGETAAGVAGIVLFAFVFSFALWRTGSLWFPVGFHTAWDWGQTAFFGTPDSGLRPTSNFLTSTLHGPMLTAGGTVGPEGTVFTPLAMLVVLGLIIVRFRRAPVAA
jgi:membrane protease YdiL (CAAX protease family)